MSSIDLFYTLNYLLPSLKQLGHENCLIVMDNAPYHSSSAIPLLSSRKSVIYDYFKANQAEGDEHLKDIKETRLWELKGKLRELRKGTDHYKIDKIVREHGHTIVRLPPYQCDLNPIELVWKGV